MSRTRREGKRKGKRIGPAHISLARGEDDGFRERRDARSRQRREDRERKKRKKKDKNAHSDFCHVEEKGGEFQTQSVDSLPLGDYERGRKKGKKEMRVGKRYTCSLLLY